MERCDAGGFRQRHHNRELDGKVLTTVTMSVSKAAGMSSGAWRAVGKYSALVLALVASAGVLSVSIESPGWFAWVTLLPLLLAIRVLHPVAASACGAVWGISLFAFLMMGEGSPVAATYLALGLLALVPAVYAFLGALFCRRFGFSALLLGFGWSGVEIALSPLGLNRGLLVGTLGLEANGLVGLAYGVLGYVCLASFIAATNGLLLSILSRAYVRVRGSSRRYVYGAASILKRVVSREDAIELFSFIRPARPRAPPV